MFRIKTVRRQARQATVRLVASLLGALLALSVSPLHANPTGGQVVGGRATITSPKNKTVQVEQHSNRAIVNWQRFDIAPGETTRFCATFPAVGHPQSCHRFDRPVTD